MEERLEMEQQVQGVVENPPLFVVFLSGWASPFGPRVLFFQTLKDMADVSRLQT